LKSFKTGIS